VNVRLVNAAPLMVVALVLCACAQANVSTRERAHRIVSLMPSFTEDLCAIGARRNLVAVSQFSDDIPCARDLPQVSNYSSVDTEKVLSLHADTLVAIPSQRAMSAALRRAGIAAAYLKNDSYTDLFDNIAALGRLTQHSAQADHLIAALHERTRTLQATERFRRRPAVFVVVQAQPIWTVGPQSYISTLIWIAGGRNAVLKLGAPYAEYSAEALLRLQPDAIIAGSDAQLPGLLQKEPWRSMRAVQLGHVYVYRPGLLDRPGPRYNEGISWLIEHLRPLAM
jgi:iron complex transport system substrate-binding protein